ncbi:hypothetical protein BDM02DRAFT_2058610 [Thelephora ganbajun]|uniref:Uncharacterized protein n=1 Tax=Thelephora ganbajun TaxID=370292 RepID=A0ACB6ZG75_THEGA|nr:hypothetical protein BDM02DRAFT_2058610 [Thelephora ganbajun]
MRFVLAQHPHTSIPIFSSGHSSPTSGLYVYFYCIAYIAWIGLSRLQRFSFHNQRGRYLAPALPLCHVRRSNISKVEAMWSLLLFGIPVCLYLFLRHPRSTGPHPTGPHPTDPRPTDPRPAGPHPTDDYKQFLIGPQPYALITEATDGMGKALAKELYDSGLNLIIHGRNKKRILSAIDELKNSSSGGDVKYFVMDANRWDMDIKEILKRFEGLNVTVFVKCIGTAYVCVPLVGEKKGLVSGKCCMALCQLVDISTHTYTGRSSNLFTKSAHGDRSHYPLSVETRTSCFVTFV